MKKNKFIATYEHKNPVDADYTLNNILDIIFEGIWDWNANTGRVNRSPGWYRMLGYEVGGLEKDVFTWENIIHPDDYDRVMNNFELYVTGKIKNYNLEYRCKKADGEYIWINDSGKIVEYNNDGSVARMIGVHRNIHEQKTAQIELIRQNQLLKEGNISLENIVRKKAEELEKKNQELKEKIIEVEHISNTDPLTNISNRKKFEEELIKEISRANRYGHSLSFAIFDLDYFKRVNDNYGHKTGDIVLQKIAKLVTVNIRSIDTFARWGGEEFVLIFPGLVIENANKVVEKLKILINQYNFESDLFITCSFGVTEYKKGESIDELFQRADNALYNAKKSGRNRVVATK